MKPKFIHFLCVCANVLLLSSCVRQEPQATEHIAQSTDYAGCYTCCFESGFFAPNPNPTSEAWFVSDAPPEFWSAVNTLPKSRGDIEAFVKVRASLGPAGQFGHMGLASREMKILEVLELRARRDDDGQCFPPPPEFRPLPDAKR